MIQSEFPMNRIRVFLVLDETRFYQPDFVAGFMERTEDLIVGAALVTKAPNQCNLDRYLIKNWHYLTPWEIFKLIGQRTKLACKDRFGRKNSKGPFCSVRSVFKHYHVEYFQVRHDINREEYLSKIRNTSPDVILSSNACYFEDELLSIPRLGCINRHSSLLPQYRGVWPVFHAYRKGERSIGVTVHQMGKQLDRGPILAQKEIQIKPGDTISDLYRESYRISVDVILEALSKLRRDGKSKTEPVGRGTYYSFPTQEHWAEFRQRGGRFV